MSDGGSDASDPARAEDVGTKARDSSERKESFGHSSEGRRKRKKPRRDNANIDCDSIESSYSGRRRRKKKDRKRKKRRNERSHEHRHKHRSSSSDNSGSESSLVSSATDQRRKKKRKKKREKKSRKVNGVTGNDAREDQEGDSTTNLAARCLAQSSGTKQQNQNRSLDASVSDPSQQWQRQEEAQKQTAARRMVPMTREEYEAEQSKVREVYDAETGRTRLVRGSGEIIERIVSKQAHQQINQQATRGDGASFSRMIHKASSRSSSRR